MNSSMALFSNMRSFPVDEHPQIRWRTISVVEVVVIITKTVMQVIGRRGFCGIVVLCRYCCTKATTSEASALKDFQLE